METIILEAKTRDLSAKAKDLLKSGVLPVELYGNGVKNQSLQVDYNDFRRVFKQTGYNTVIKLKIDGKTDSDVLVNDLQAHSVTDDFMHVDFINVRMDQEIHTHIPLEFTGIAPAVKDLGGVLTPNLHQINVKCLPGALVHQIVVDISPLVDLHTSIRVKDLKLPPGITVMNSPEDSVVTVVAIKVEEEAPKVEAAVEASGEVPAEGAVPVEGGAAPVAGAPGAMPAKAEKSGKAGK